MKIRIFFPILLLLFGAKVYAFEGNGFKVLSRSIEISSGVTGGFIDKTKTHSKSPVKTAIAWAQAHDAQARVNETVRLSGSHSVTLYNTTSVKQVYHYKFELNCDGQFTREVGELELQPGATATKNFESYLNSKHTTAGNYRINVITDITGELPVTYTSVGNLKVTDK